MASDESKDAMSDDPFFRLTNDSDWNACIGSQGDEENYLEGYLEAPIELVNAVIEKKQYGKRDTLVLPILYNARHSLELGLKFTIDRLVKAGVLSTAPPRNHDIRGYWNLLNNANLGDEALRSSVATLKPYIDSLSRIDADGQELRYHLNKDEGQSLSTYSLANLEVIRDGLVNLSKIIIAMRNRTLDFLAERRTGTFTGRLSRSDLFQVANMLPPLSEWNNPKFDIQKQAIKSRFNLSNHQFSKALNLIKSNRELKSRLGAETSLIYIPDKLLIWIIDQWRTVHPVEIGQPRVIRFSHGDFEDMRKYLQTKSQVISKVRKRLTPQQLVELEKIYHFGRDRWFPEYYEDEVAKGVENYRENEEAEKVGYLITKTNLLTAIRRGLERLGKPKLASRLD
jgi:hypothetical protein